MEANDDFICGWITNLLRGANEVFGGFETVPPFGKFWLSIENYFFNRGMVTFEDHDAVPIFCCKWLAT